MDDWNADERRRVFRRRHGAARVRPYLAPLVAPLVGPERAPAPALLSRVLDGLRGLPERGSDQASRPREAYRTPLLRLIDAQKAPTEEIPVVTAGVVVS